MIDNSGRRLPVGIYMTLVVGAMSTGGLWLMTDRRLSFGDGRATVDDAVKVFEFQGTDGIALFGYAGLGQTAAGSQPSDWMLRTLRGARCTIEQAVHVLGAGLRDHLAPHLQEITWAGTRLEHSLFAVSMVSGVPCAYSYTVEIQADGSPKLTGDWLRPAVGKDGSAPVLAFAGGSGRPYLDAGHLQRVVKAQDAGRLTARSVARYFAKLNWQVHEKCGTVGPRCIVVRKEGHGGGQNWHFTGVEQDRNSPAIPALAGGMDVQALAEDMMSAMRPAMDAFRRQAEAAREEGRPVDMEAFRRIGSGEHMKEALEVFNRRPKGSDPTLK